MYYKKLAPSSKFNSIIDSYFFWKSEHLSNKPLEIETPPNGYNAVIFNYGDAYQVIQNHTLYEPASCFISGQATSSYQLHLFNNIAMAGIVFYPTALNKIFGLHAGELTNQRIDLGALIPEYKLKIILELLYFSSTIAQQYAILENFVTQLIKGKEIKYNQVDYAYALIKSSKGNLQIKPLADQVAICPRHFRRKFYTQVGVTPKEYIRIVRLAQVCYRLINQDSINWHDVIYQYGYYDQSHFIKDFTQFMGRNPAAYYKKNKELANIIDD